MARVLVLVWLTLALARCGAIAVRAPLAPMDVREGSSRLRDARSQQRTKPGGAALVAVWHGSRLRSPA